MSSMNTRGHVGFTGTQNGCSPAQEQSLRRVLYRLLGNHDAVLHHGDCVGADALAHRIARDMGRRVVIHPPDVSTKRAFCTGAWRVLDPRPYLVRNGHIVQQSNRLVATPSGETEALRSGTWSTIRRARKADILIIIIYPSGRIDEEWTGHPFLSEAQYDAIYE